MKWLLASIPVALLTILVPSLARAPASGRPQLVFAAAATGQANRDDAILKALQSIGDKLDKMAAPVRQPPNEPQSPAAKSPPSDPLLVKISEALEQLLNETVKSNNAILVRIDGLAKPPAVATTPSHKPAGGSGVQPFHGYTQGYTIAVSERKPLLVWVNYRCGSSACQLPNFIHTYVDTLNGSDVPRVIVGVPDGGGGFTTFRESVGAADVSANNIRAATSPPAPVATAAAFPQMMPMMMGGGGYGGGFGGGGGGFRGGAG